MTFPSFGCGQHHCVYNRSERHHKIQSIKNNMFICCRGIAKCSVSDEICLSLGTINVCHIYINDTDESIGCNVLKFADDTNNFWEIKSPQDVVRLQKDFANLAAWSHYWEMIFNVRNARSCIWAI